MWYIGLIGVEVEQETIYSTSSPSVWSEAFYEFRAQLA